MKYNLIGAGNTKYFLILILLSFPFILRAQRDSTDIQIQLQKRVVELEKLLEAIEQQTSFHFSYSTEKIKVRTFINLPNIAPSLSQVLNLLKDHYGINFVYQDKNIILQSLKTKTASATISGIVRDGKTGEALPGAQIILTRSFEGATSNRYGFYSLTHSSGIDYNLQVRYLGYVNFNFTYNFNKDTVINIALQPDMIVLADVTITSNRIDSLQDIKSSPSVYIVSAKKIKDTPAFGGEPDALKTLQFLPGVQSGNEGTSNLSVRGGSFDQNLYLLDESPIYNPSHALSFFSIFNPDALQSISLYKSQIPSRYGGRLSSVVDVRMKEGNKSRLAVSGALGTVASRLTAEGPIVKNKASFMVSGRYSYVGSVVNGMYAVGSLFGDPTSNNSPTDNKINFYDLNMKVNFQSSTKDHFYLSAYTGNDQFQFNNITSGYALAWGNKTATFRWNHIYSSRLFSNTTALFSNYNYEYRILNNTQYFLWKASLKELDIKQDYDFYVNTNNTIKFGGGIEGHQISPGQISPRSSDAVARLYSLPSQKPTGTYLYLENKQLVGKKLTLNYGLRYSNFIIGGSSTRYKFNGGEDFPYDSTQYHRGQVEKIYQMIDPRLSLTLSQGIHSWSASYDHTTQYFHLLANSSVGLPTDIWMPSGGTIKPQTAHIFAVSYEPHFSKNYEGNVAVYYKRLNNILDFKDNANLFVNKYIESQLLQGYGEAYGLELFFQKTLGKLRYSVSYTLSKAENTIKGVNNDQPFPSRYDKRHNVSITGKWSISKRLEASANFVYTTGGAITVPKGNFMFDGVVFNNYSNRNGYRFRDYNRLDLSLRYTRARNDKRAYKSFWSLDVYNIYGRNNPFSIYSQTADYGFTNTNLKAIYLFGVVPTLSYNFTF